MPILRRFLDMIPGVASVDFRSLSGAAKARAEALLAADPVLVSPEEIVAALDGGRGRFRAEFERVRAEVVRRCEGAEIWQNFYLDLLDDEDEPNEEGEAGVGADPVAPDEELRRLLAGVTVFPAVRPEYAWELGYHTLRYALARTEPPMHVFAARSAAQDFLAAFQAATDVEGRINALGDLAGAHFLAGDAATAVLLCDYAAAEISPVEAVRQELHRLRREGPAFVREGYGVVTDRPAS